MLRRTRLFAALATTILANAAQADDFTFRMGWGVFQTTGSAIYSLGYEDYINQSSFIYRFDFGAWTDNRENRSSSPFTAFALGYRSGSTEHLYMQVTAGIAAIGLPDQQLGSVFQFNECAALGWGIARAEYCHFSSADIGSPNLGRNYPAVVFVFPLSY